MRSKRGVFALSLSGYIIWQRHDSARASALGTNTPIPTMKRGATIAEHALNKDVSNL